MNHERAEDHHPSPSSIRRRWQLLFLVVLLPLLAGDDRHGNLRWWWWLLHFSSSPLTSTWSWVVKGTAVVHVRRTPPNCCFQRYRNATERRRRRRCCCPSLSVRLLAVAVRAQSWDALLLVLVVIWKFRFWWWDLFVVCYWLEMQWQADSKVNTLEVFVFCCYQTIFRS